MPKLPTIPLSEYKERVAKVQAAMKLSGYDLLLAYGNEAEPQYVRYFSNYWPSFETAGVLDTGYLVELCEEYYKG